MIQLRNTVQKEKIYSALTELANHPTADEVYDRVRADAPTISRATVYRVLNQMADGGTVSRISIPGGAAHFDHIALPHLHVRCVRCGCVRDVKGNADISVDYSRLSAPDFEITGYNLIFEGLCGSCK